MNERRSAQRLRCAIYTRKSTEEGLEQAFNSLHAQREACEAFITSQRHQGWTLDPTHYDDGGFSGGTIERPALKRLMHDIEAGRIDVIVVYKVDRLTRALSDFAKLVDLFDRKQVSFVSITQQFNTTTSMGRLTLNVLLSFAQFEREVIGERIRDKIAASKRKGMWMGGQPPLGYDVQARKLIVNDAEADTVVAIFRRYLELRSVHALRDEFQARGVTSKRRCRPDGSAYGGQPLGRGGLYAMLQNRIYRGEITHKGSAYAGEHPVIIDQALWDQVQAQLTGSRDERASGSSAKEPALLGGMLFDADRERLTPTHAVKNGTRYRYYVSASLVRGRTPTRSAWRIPASDLDGIVIQTLCGMLQDPTLLLEALDGAESRTSPAQSLIVQARALAQHLSSAPAKQQRADLVALSCRVLVSAGQVELQISRAKLLKRLSGSNASPPDDPAEEDDRINRTISVSLKRAGREMRMVEEGAVCRHVPDPSLLRLLGRAHHLHGKLVSGPSLTVAQLAAKENLSVAYVYRLLRLRWLAPDIVVTIMNGHQPRSLNATVLMHQKFRIPIAWTEQRRHFGVS